jgi:hypothetical protein
LKCGSTADEEEFMAKKPAKKRKSSTKKAKEVSVRAVRKAIKGVKKKMTGVSTPSAKALRTNLTTFDRSINCGQTQFLDISS